MLKPVIKHPSFHFEKIPKNYFRCLDAYILIVIILLGFLLYIPALRSTSFYFDDKSSIVENASIKQMDIPRIFNAFNTRFLVGLTFALNYKFSALHPVAYRITNLLIHCLNAFLVYLLAKFILNWPIIRTLVVTCHPEPFASLEGGLSEGYKGVLRFFASLRMTNNLEWPAFFASMLFLCHPIQTEPVNFITQRFVLMGTFFYLLTLLLYIQYRFLLKKNYLFAAMISCLAAMFCKEFTVTLPVMLGVYEFYFLDALAQPWWKRFRSILPFFIIVLIVPIMLIRTPTQAVGVASIADSNLILTGKERIREHIDITRALGDIGRKQYFLTELNVVRTYVRLLFLPVNQNLDYDYPLSSRLDAKTLLSGMFLLCFLIIAWVTYKSYRIVSFGILWFFIALSVESSIIPIGHVIAEYRLYLANVGFVFLVTELIYTRPIDVRRLNIIAAVILIVFSVLTYQRNKVWKDSFTLWDDVARKSPYKERGYINRGVEYYDKGKITQAYSDFNKAIALNPKNAEAYCTRGVIYAKQNKFVEAFADFNKAIELDPFNAEAYNNRSNLYTKIGDFPDALFDLNRSIEILPDYTEAYFNRGNVHYRQNNYTQAIHDYTKAIGINPQFEKAYPNLVVIYLVLKEFDKAWGFVNKAKEAGCPIDPKLIKLFKDSSETNPKDAESFNIDGVDYVKQGNFDKAFADFSKAIELDPNNARAYNNRSNLYIQRGDLTGALADLNKTIELNPNMVEAYFNRGNVYYRQNNFTQAIVDYTKVINLNPRFEKAYNNLIAVYFGLKKFNKAWAYVHKAQEVGVSINPKLIETLKEASGGNR